MSNLTWKSPYPVRQTWFTQEIRDELGAHPGEWALIAVGIKYGSVTQQKNAWPQFEFTTRAREDGGPDREVYARFVGTGNTVKVAALTEEKSTAADTIREALALAVAAPGEWVHVAEGEPYGRIQMWRKEAKRIKADGTVKVSQRAIKASDGRVELAGLNDIFARFAPWSAS